MLVDLTKAQETMRRQALQDELERLQPTIDLEAAQAEQLLSNFAEFWKRLLVATGEQLGPRRL